MKRLGPRDRFVLLSFSGQLLWLCGMWWPVPVALLTAAVVVLVRY